MSTFLIILLSLVIGIAVAKTFWQFLIATIICILATPIIGGVLSFIVLKLWNSRYI